MERHIREYLCQLNWYAITAGTLFIASTPKAQAQSNIVPDNTLGDESSIINPNADIANILSRVTGNNISEIFGTLGTIGEYNFQCR